MLESVAIVARAAQEDRPVGAGAVHYLFRLFRKENTR